MVDVAKATVRYEGDLTDLEAANRKAKASVKETAKDIDKSTEKVSSGFGKIGEKAIKVFAVLGFVEAGLKATDAALKLFTGDLDGAADALKTLPFGIGPAVGALELLLGTIDGTNEALGESTERLKEITEQSAKLDRATAILQKIESERTRFGKTPQEIAAINITKETKDRVKALEDVGRTEREIRLARELGANKLLQIERTQRDERKRERDAARGGGEAVQTSIRGFMAARAIGDPGMLDILRGILLQTKRTADREGLI